MPMLLLTDSKWTAIRNRVIGCFGWMRSIANETACSVRCKLPLNDSGTAIATSSIQRLVAFVFKVANFTVCC